MNAFGTIRRLSAIERGKMRDHLLRLDPEDRLLRFGGYVSDAYIDGYCDGLDWDRAVLIGYLVDGEVRGVGELRPMAEGWSMAAEAALSVERPYQNRGVGTELLRRLMVIGRNRSIRSLHMLCLLENGKVLRIARKLGAKLTFDHGEVEGRLALPWPNHLTLLLELLDDASGVLAVLRPGPLPAPADRPRRTFRTRSRRERSIPPGDGRNRAGRDRSHAFIGRRFVPDRWRGAGTPR
jgi:GNAT superfamily N-acetyltransferase